MDLDEKLVLDRLGDRNVINDNLLLFLRSEASLVGEVAAATS